MKRQDELWKLSSNSVLLMCKLSFTDVSEIISVI
jgi:hypothetical protein